MSASRYAVVRRLSRVLLLPLHGHIGTNDRTSSSMNLIDTKAFIHRVDSSTSNRVIIFRHSSLKQRSICSISTLNNENNNQPSSTIIMNPSFTGEKPKKSLLKMRHRKTKGLSSTDDQQICTKENCLTCCKKFTAFMFSRVGLFFVMIGYVALGGWLFQALEARNEQDMRRSMNEKLNSTLYKLWDEILRVNSYPYQDKKGNFTLYATQELEKFEATVIHQVQQGFDGRTRPGADPDWNYFGAVLYAVTLVSTIGYGHITTKTVPGKIATVLYSAFGVPLMMLFVANIGSTMAKLFAFVFTRIKILFCCQWKNKKKNVSIRKLSHTIDASKLTIAKSSLKRTKDNQEVSEKIPLDESVIPTLPPQRQSTSNSPALNDNKNRLVTLDTKQLPADVRLNMLTGVPTMANKSPSIGSSTHTTEERSKDALDRINELIRKNSVPNADNKVNDHLSTSIHQRQRRKSEDISPIQFYINETNKLTSKLETALDDEDIIKPEEEKLDDVNKPQEIINNETDNPKVERLTPKKNFLLHKLTRSKSESTHDRTSTGAKILSPVNTTNNDRITKSPRRRFFLCKTRKQSIDETKTNESHSQLKRKSLSFDDRLRSFPPPPDYEEPIVSEISTVPTVTWKPGDELYTSKPPYGFPTNTQSDDDEEEYYEDEEMSVPLLVTVFVIPLYLTLGAILFNIWEKWGFLNSFYFCFTTLTTIGFGDYVPGASITVRAAKEKLICASLYILLGLVLIAMCFNLMKEQLSQKVKKIASKWGILEL